MNTPWDFEEVTNEDQLEDEWEHLEQERTKRTRQSEIINR